MYIKHKCGIRANKSAQLWYNRYYYEYIELSIFYASLYNVLR